MDITNIYDHSFIQPKQKEDNKTTIKY